MNPKPENEMNQTENPDTVSMDASRQPLPPPFPLDPFRVVLMGSEGSGKTCFYAGLAWLGDASRGGDFHEVVGLDERTQAVVNGLRDTLARGSKPPPSHDSLPLHLQVDFRNAHMQLEAEDFAGEDFRAAGMDLPDDNPFAVKIRGAEYLLLFLDIENDVHLSSEATSNRLNAVVNLLARHARDPKLAVILSKSDLKQDGEDGCDNPEKYLKAKQPGFHANLESLGLDTSYFFLAPLGKADLSPDNRPEPQGYEELFGWMVSKRRGILWARWWARWREKHKKFLRWAVALLLLGSAACVAGGVAWYRGNERVKNGDGTSIFAPPSAFDEWANKFIDEIDEELPAIQDFEALDKYSREIDEKQDRCSSETRRRLETSRTDIRNRREDIHVERIQRLEKDLKRCRDAIAEYEMDTKKSNRRSAEVAAVAKRIAASEDAQRRAEIDGTVVVAGKPDTLQQKCDLVAVYPFASKAEAAEAARAVAVGRMFLANDPYDLKIESAAMLENSRSTRLVLTKNGPGTSQEELTEYVDSRNPQWNHEFKLRWKPGDRISLRWQWKAMVGLDETTVGRASFADPWTSLLDILGGCELEPSERRLFHTRAVGIPTARISCKQFPKAKEDLWVFRKYLVPGVYWKDGGKP